MAYGEHLKKRGKWWHTRRRVPKGLRALFGEEIQHPLQTTDRAVAAVRARAFNARLDAVFEAAQRGVYAKEGELSREEAAALVDRIAAAHLREMILRDREAEYQAAGDVPADFDPFEEMLNVLDDAAVEALYEDGDPAILTQLFAEALDAAKERGAEVPPIPDGQIDHVSREVAMRFRDGLRVRLEHRLSEQQGRPLPLPPVPGELDGAVVERLERIEAKIDANGAEPGVGRSAVAEPKTLTDAMSDYLERKALTSWNESTAEANTALLKRMVDFFGPTTLVAELNDKDVMRWIVRRQREGVGPTTVNKDLTLLGGLLGYAIEEGWATRNVTRGLRLKQVTSADEQRDAYTPEQLRKLFSPALVEASFGAPRGPRPERFWLLVLHLMTGARRGELAKLRIKDVGTEDGVPFISIPTSKTKSGVRLIPLHHAIIDLGFLKYVARRRSEGATVVFPEEIHQGKNAGNRTTQWFTMAGRGYRDRMLGKTDAKLDLYSLRHTLAGRLREADVPKESIKEILGHFNAETDTTLRYMKKLRLAKLAEVIERVSWADILRDLPAVEET